MASGNQVYAFDAAGCGAATCAPLWTTSLDLDGERVEAAGSRPVVGPDDTVYVGALAGGLQTLVRALDGQTGAHLWRTDVHPGPGPGWQNLALAHGQLYVSDQRHGSPGNAVEVFAAEGCGQPVCAPVWSASIDGPPVAGLTVGGDVLYVGLFGSTNSRLVAFDARGCGSATCARLGAVDFGDRQPLQVSVADGRLAVVSVGRRDTPCGYWCRADPALSLSNGWPAPHGRRPPGTSGDASPARSAFANASTWARIRSVV